MSIETKTVSIESLTSAEVIEVDLSMPATERCDRCDAQAFVEAEMPSKGVLLFCAHHYGAHEDKVKQQAVRIIDHRPALVASEKRFKGQPA